MLHTQTQRDRDRQIVAFAESWLKDDALRVFGNKGPEQVEKHLLPFRNDRCADLAELYCRMVESSINRRDMRSVILSKKPVSSLRAALMQFDPRAVMNKYATAEMLLERALADAIPSTAPRTAARSHWPQFCASAISAAGFLSQFLSASDFYLWADHLSRDERSREALPLIISSEVRGFGFALACDFLKEVGFNNYGKPDVHIRDIFNALGLRVRNPYRKENDVSLFRDLLRVSSNAERTPYETDRLFWIIGSGKLDRIDADKVFFVKSKQRFISSALQHLPPSAASST